MSESDSADPQVPALQAAACHLSGCETFQHQDHAWGQAILLNFGLAKEYDPTKSTTVGARAFTPGFAPPDQYGQGSTDPRIDVYSFGATLYNLLTSEVPADGLRRAIGGERLIDSRIHTELRPGSFHRVAKPADVSMQSFN